MNYRHIYHAGNFADVFKHSLLILLLEYLLKKEKPICYLDTHAGIGNYDLQSELAQKTKEYENGVSRVYNLTDCPPAIKNYQKIIRDLNLAKNSGDSLPRYYPGSPQIAAALLRATDRIILTELHQDDVQTLRREFRNDARVAVHHMNGYQAIKAFLPPKERRGLILIDPSFEEPNEIEQIITALQIAWRKFPTGIYAIWYPINERIDVPRFYAELKNIGFAETLITELTQNELQVESLTKCGLAIINPPFGLEGMLQKFLPWLSNTLFSDKKNSCYKIFQLL